MLLLQYISRAEKYAGDSFYISVLRNVHAPGVSSKKVPFTVVQEVSKKRYITSFMLFFRMPFRVSEKEKAFKYLKLRGNLRCATGALLD